MILVMGASGNIGREIVKDLHAKGVAFLGAPKEADRARQAGVETVIVDYGQPATLDAALQGIEKAFFVTFPSPPDADWVKALVASSVSEWLAEGMLDLMHYYRKGKAGRVSPTVEQVTGQKPISYRQFVEGFAPALRF